MLVYFYFDFKLNNKKLFFNLYIFIHKTNSFKYYTESSKETKKLVSKHSRTLAI